MSNRPVLPHPYDAPPSTYSYRDLESLVRYHQHVAEHHQLEQPYFLHTDKGDEFIIHDEFFFPNLRLVGGRVGSFTKHEIASVIQKQIASYVLMNGMGSGYPNDETTNELFLSYLMDCGPDDVFLAVDTRSAHNLYDLHTPVASMKLSIGRSDQPIRELNQKQASIFTTFSAIELSSDSWDRHPDLAATPESQLVHLGRLFRLPNHHLRELGYYSPKYSQLVKEMVRKTKQIYQNHLLNDSDFKYIVLDTTHHRITDLLVSDFDAVIIADYTSVKPTPLAQNDPVLKHHFSPKEWENKLSVVAIPLTNVRSSKR